MRRIMWFIPVGALILVAGTAAQSPPTTAVASIKQLQEAMISPASDTIFNVGRSAPQTEADWLTVRNAAVILAEAGNLFMLEGRAKDTGQWMELAGALVDAGTAALRATDARDVNGVLDAGDRIAEVCEACHQPYRDGGRAMGPQPEPGQDGAPPR